MPGLIAHTDTALDSTAREWVAAGDAGLTKPTVRGHGSVEAAGVVEVSKAEVWGRAASVGNAGL
jgi:hypothetical protein